MKKNWIFLFALLAIAACQGGGSDYLKMEPSIETDKEYVSMAAPRALSEEQLESELGNSPIAKVIKTAYLSIEVDEYEKGRSGIDSLAGLFGARIVNENMQNYDNRITNDFYIRIPVAQFEGLQSAICSLAKRIDYQRIESVDVTEEYIDVEARLSNQRRVENTFVRLLHRTDSVEDILKIETKLAEVRGQIESLTGRMKYLNNQVEFSTIHLTLYQKVEFKYQPEEPNPFGERLKKALTIGWRGIVGLLLVILGLWPLWLIGAAIWVGIVLHRRRKWQSQKATKRGQKERRKDKKDRLKSRVKTKEKEKEKEKEKTAPDFKGSEGQ